MSTPYDDLLDLIKPALDEMVREGFTVGWRVDYTRRDYVEFSNEHKPGVVIGWDDSRMLRWHVSNTEHKSVSAAKLGEVISKAKTVGILL